MQLLLLLSLNVAEQLSKIRSPNIRIQKQSFHFAYLALLPSNKVAIFNNIMTVINQKKKKNSDTCLEHSLNSAVISLQSF